MIFKEIGQHGRPGTHIFFDCINEKFFIDSKYEGNQGMFTFFIGSVNCEVRARNMLDKLNDNKKKIIEYLNITTLSKMKKKKKKVAKKPEVTPPGKAKEMSNPTMMLSLSELMATPNPSILAEIFKPFDPDEDD